MIQCGKPHISCIDTLFLELASRDHSNAVALSQLCLKKKFKSTTTFYTVICLNNIHWVLAKLRPEVRCIEIFDSLVQCTSGKKLGFGSVLETKIKILTQSVAYLLCMEPYDWDIQYRNVIQQTDQSSCGIYSLIFARRLINGLDIENIRPEETEIMRRQLLAEIVGQRLKFDLIPSQWKLDILRMRSDPSLKG